MSDDVDRDEGFMVFQLHPAHGFRPSHIFFPTREAADSAAVKLLERNLPTIVIPATWYSNSLMRSGAGLPFHD